MVQLYKPLAGNLIPFVNVYQCVFILWRPLQSLSSLFGAN